MPRSTVAGGHVPASCSAVLPPTLRGVLDGRDRGGGELPVLAQQQQPAGVRLGADRVSGDRADHRVASGVGEPGGGEARARCSAIDHRGRGSGGWRARADPAPGRSHGARLGVSRAGAARRTSRSSSSVISWTVESTASSATPESVSCSSSAVAVSSTVLQLRSRIAGGARLGVAHEPLDLVVDQVERLRADRAEVLQRGAEEHLAALLADRDEPERVGHAEGGDHAARERGRGVQVVVDARRDVPEGDPLAGEARP